MNFIKHRRNLLKEMVLMINKNSLGKDFMELEKRAEKIPEVKEYLQRFSVIIGDLVLARRLQLGLTQKKLAQLAGTTQATISRIEAGDEGVKAGTLNNIFRVLKLSHIHPEFSEDAASKEVTLITM